MGENGKSKFHAISFNHFGEGGNRLFLLLSDSGILLISINHLQKALEKT